MNASYSGSGDLARTGQDASLKSAAGRAGVTVALFLTPFFSGTHWRTRPGLLACPPPAAAGSGSAAAKLSPMTSDTQPLPARTISAGSTLLRATGSLALLTWPALDESGAVAAVTARSGGVSSGPYATLNLSLSVGDDPENVLENRRRLAAGFGACLDDFVFAGQVHGAGVRVVGEADRGRGAFSLDDAIRDTDALITKSPGVILAILTADCVPIVLHDPVGGVLACVHAGWRGTVARVSAAAVAAMQSLGSRPSDMIAGMGPAIAPARYQVGPDVYRAVTQAFGPAAAAFIRPDPGTPASASSRPGSSCGQRRWLLDLWAANRHALCEAGVPGPQIHVTDLPTGPIDDAALDAPTDHTGPAGPASPWYFFSDRSARPCGRLALVARLRAPSRTLMDVTT
jgi:YfiH family protein